LQTKYLGSCLVLDKEKIQEHFDLAEECYLRNRLLLHSFFKDWLGCLVAGLNAPQSKPLMQSLQIKDQRADVAQYSLLDKSMLFGFASHCLELDDSEFIGETHPSSVFFSSLFSSGDDSLRIKDLFEASSVGYLSLITFGKLLNPTHYEKGWHGTGTIGSLAATLALSFLHRMSSDEASLSLGVVSNLLSGLHMNFGSEAKFLAAGRAALNATLATRLVRNGMAAKPIEYSGAKGFQVMFSGGSIGAPEVAANTFSFVKAKHFPVCHCLDPIIISFQEIMRSSKISKDQVELVEVFISPYSRGILRFDFPKTAQEAKFSIPYCLSHFSLCDSGELYADAGKFHNNLRDSFAKKIRVFTDTSICEMDYRITIKCSNGKVLDNFFSFGRGFEFQNREFVHSKATSLISPYLTICDNSDSFLPELESRIEECSVGDLRRVINKNIKFPGAVVF
jgi:2-methylcitrate dehydratase PrpD